MRFPSDKAWNSFVMRSDPASYELGTAEHDAALAARFMAGAGNGGLNSFLTAAHDLHAWEVLEALRKVGASKAADQLAIVLEGLGTSVLASSQDERWTLLDQHWREDLDKHDALASDADEELLAALKAHVATREELYRRLS